MKPGSSAGPSTSIPIDPDPGRVTLRRLNRVEYRETIRDLMGIDFRADEEFPADDTGYGFDNIGDVLAVSPLLLEKYMQAAETIVATAVPIVARVVKVRTIPGSDFRSEGKPFDRLSLYKAATLEHSVKLERGGSYRLFLDMSARGQFDFDPARAKVIFRLDDKELVAEEFGWGDARKPAREIALELPPGDHKLAIRDQAARTGRAEAGRRHVPDQLGEARRADGRGGLGPPR